MKVRTELELLKIIKESLERPNLNITGLCALIDKLWNQEGLINYYETDTLYEILRLNKPLLARIKSRLFGNIINRRGHYIGTYWWKIGSIPPRKRFVNRLIIKYQSKLK